MAYSCHLPFHLHINVVQVPLQVLTLTHQARCTRWMYANVCDMSVTRKEIKRERERERDRYRERETERDRERERERQRQVKYRESERERERERERDSLREEKKYEDAHNGRLASGMRLEMQESVESGNRACFTR